MKLGTLSASSLGGRVGDLGAERQSRGMKFHKAESKGLASGSNQSLSWKLTLRNGTKETSWEAGSHHTVGTRSHPGPLPLTRPAAAAPGTGLGCEGTKASPGRGFGLAQPCGNKLEANWADWC